jgi:FtsP/CotA-like multicopper oxidase with cupredoxin domain
VWSLLVTGAHKDQLWGDINVVNGVPWPVLDIKSTWHRFRVLNASPSRPWILQVSGLASLHLHLVCCFSTCQLLWLQVGAQPDFQWDTILACYSAIRNTLLFAILQFRDEAGKEIGSDKCYIIGSDGGIIPEAGKHKLPKAGLLTDVAYRWDIICDFTGYSKDVRAFLFLLLKWAF